MLPVSVETWNEFVFVNPDPDATAAARGDPRVRAAGASSVALTSPATDYHGRYTYEIPANWKVWVENASECYHCPTVHKHSFSDAFVDDADVYEYVDGDRVLGQFTRYNERAKRYPATPRDEAIQFRYTYIWPVTTLVQDDYAGFPGTIMPTGPESCRFIADMYVHPDCEQSVLAERLEMWNATLEEDAEVVRLQQPGLRSQMVPNGRLMPASESAISRFHRMVFESFAEVLNGGSGAAHAALTARTPRYGADDGVRRFAPPPSTPPPPRRRDDMGRRRLRREPRGVRVDQRSGPAEFGLVGSRGLAGQHIERTAGQPPTPQRLAERIVSTSSALAQLTR